MFTSSSPPYVRPSFNFMPWTRPRLTANVRQMLPSTLPAAEFHEVFALHGEIFFNLANGLPLHFLAFKGIANSLSLGVRGIGFFCSICTRKCLLPCLCFLRGSQNYTKYRHCSFFICYSLSVIKLLSFFVQFALENVPHPVLRCLRCVFRVMRIYVKNICTDLINLLPSIHLVLYNCFSLFNLHSKTFLIRRLFSSCFLKLHEQYLHGPL